MENNRSVIKTDKVKIAQLKVDETKGIMKNNVIQMSENVGMVKEKLLP
jgi:hypothetical protein